jgi:hypothetical protein
VTLAEGTVSRDNLAGVAVAFALASALVYGKTATFEFLPTWDDGESVIDNPDVRDLSWRGVARTFTRTTSALYQPLTTVTFAVDRALWGLAPAGFHVTNVVLHAAAAYVLFLLVHAIAGTTLVALTAALLFLLHPVNVENVAWVTERKSILSALLFFAAILAYVRARDRGARFPWAGSAVFGIAAILAKPTAVVLPVVIVAYEHWQRPGGRVRLALPLVPISIAGCIPTLVAHLNRAIPAESLSPATLFGLVYPSMTVVCWKYLWLLVWPPALGAFHDTTLHGWLELPVLVASGAWIAVFALVLTRGSREVRFWFSWIWICFLPTSNILPLPTYYADRYVYTPAIGVFVLLGIAARRARDGLRAGGRPWLARAPVAILAVLVLIAAVAASSRADVWRDEVALWEDTVQRSPRMYLPRLNLGAAYQLRGRYDEAEQQYLEAIRIAPTDDVLRNLRVVRLLRGERAARSGSAETKAPRDVSQD